MRRSIAVGFVVYAPEASVLTRLQLLANQDFDVYIFDNSPWQSDVRDFCSTYKNANYFTIGKNVGLGFGMSSVCAQAHYADHSALLFFDQDTVFNQETLTFIENYFLANAQLIHTYSAIAFSAKQTPEAANPTCFHEASMIINSGSLFILENLKQLGWHNEKYFVDCVDYEFCLRSHVRGFKIGSYSCTPGFDHSTEQADNRFKIFGTLHSFRAYPMFRITDTITASLKLIVKSVFSTEFKYAAKLCRLLAYYLAAQILARILQPVSINEERQ